MPISSKDKHFAKKEKLWLRRCVLVLCGGGLYAELYSMAYILTALLPERPIYDMSIST